MVSGPVWMKVIAGSWLIASVCIERMMVMSSIILPHIISNAAAHAVCGCIG